MSGRGGYRPGSGRKPGPIPFKDRVKEHQAAYYQENKEKIRAQQREYYHANKDKMREFRLKKAFGISLAEYDAMLAKQDFRCAICGTDEPMTESGVFCVDHNHETGAVRGLLCSHCNKGLGCAKDDTNILYAMIEYLEVTS